MADEQPDDGVGGGLDVVGVEIGCPGGDVVLHDLTGQYQQWLGIGRDQREQGVVAAFQGAGQDGAQQRVDRRVADAEPRLASMAAITSVCRSISSETPSMYRWASRRISASPSCCLEPNSL